MEEVKERKVIEIKQGNALEEGVDIERGDILIMNGKTKELVICLTQNVIETVRRAGTGITNLMYRAWELYNFGEIKVVSERTYPYGEEKNWRTRLKEAGL
ncbi:MAG: hypothetical protein AABX71_01710 [Nanoarchaeota archaeon]